MTVGAEAEAPKPDSQVLAIALDMPTEGRNEAVQDPTALPNDAIGGDASSSTLNLCRVGQAGIVTAVSRLDALGDRLAELGLTPGARVQVVRRAPFGGPILLRVRDYLLTVRHAEAATIAVQLSAARQS